MACMDTPDEPLTDDQRFLAAMREIAHNGGPETLSMARHTLRALIEGFDAEARAMIKTFDKFLGTCPPRDEYGCCSYCRPNFGNVCYGDCEWHEMRAKVDGWLNK